MAILGQALGLEQCHFCHVLYWPASHGTAPNSRDDKMNSQVLVAAATKYHGHVFSLILDYERYKPGDEIG